jgi:hypothetical protein
MSTGRHAGLSAAALVLAACATPAAEPVPGAVAAGSTSAPEGRSAVAPLAIARESQALTLADQAITLACTAAALAVAELQNPVADGNALTHRADEEALRWLAQAEAYGLSGPQIVETARALAASGQLSTAHSACRRYPRA